MGEQEQINLRVDPAQKARWQTRVDEPDVDAGTFVRRGLDVERNRVGVEDELSQL